MTTPSVELLSPSRAWRLTQCPASGGPSGPRNGPATAQRNAGTLAHDALELWIKDEGFRESDPKAALARALDGALAAAGGIAPPRWTMIRSRLRARAGELVAALEGSATSQVIPEERIVDTALGIEGTPDVVVIGDRVALLDLKTEEMENDEVSQWAMFQLRVYAHLVEIAYGRLPSRVEIFSANRGRLPVQVTRADVDAARAELRAAHVADRSIAKPVPETCFFCRRRMICQPHWDAAAAWLGRDCVEGRLTHTEHAANGLVAAQLQTSGGDLWVSGIPDSVLTAATDSTVRFVRLTATRDKNGDSVNWRWSPVSEVREM
ncbi:uncharacterized protein RMCC_4086 [Mycolicibacterium canariasense]|uniref:PD-(D/E)XK endonuclease-like domain-containing protein n=1 Tax=Mycolicibacterium canariasense TaxID=228230 RepID=A0A100WFE5_MYCCR|nr:PD-(D/E)XK nuclease family protein [Mycolicibacterium canariasense]MCV7211398.1 PD-(D/E)XK nuclease family protein [Mycolicibacterium canariasense]ORV08527.1 hypothetical protein AWB94_12375 [Mycolicibacterium canariasense]GAS97120.1 uncharacterized protein RMCC_4086 [Mycolicibacterium canariasense]